jgi:16S rRNA pseudouridine516 synthase
MRLDKFLANAGVGTRSEVKTIIRKGLVVLNGEVVTDNDMDVHPETDEVLVDDAPIAYQEFVYVILNKPKGYVSAKEDRDDPTVISLILGYEHRDLHIVGRLDKDTTGLLVITDDGKLTHKLTSPKHDVAKTYLLEVNAPIDEALVTAFTKGFALGESDKVLPSKLVILPTKNQALLTIHEGKFHQVKRMFAKFGYTVSELQRVAIGTLELGDLKVGEFRDLTKDEVTKLKSL